MVNSAQLIRARVTGVDREIAEHETALRLLREERAELMTALRVIGRFAHDDAEIGAHEPDLEQRRLDIVAAAEQTAQAQEAELERGKPDGTPTVPEMIHEVLLRPHLLGDAGMEPKDILAKIKERWWPDAPSTSVGPIAWRMWKKEGRLVKDGNLYSLPPAGDRAPPGSDSASAARAGGLFPEAVALHAEGAG